MKVRAVSTSLGLKNEFNIAYALDVKCVNENKEEHKKIVKEVRLNI